MKPLTFVACFGHYDVLAKTGNRMTTAINFFGQKDIGSSARTTYTVTKSVRSRSHSRPCLSVLESKTLEQRKRKQNQSFFFSLSTSQKIS